MKVLAIIPARSGSVRLPGKNRELVGGIPLWRRAVDCAKDAHCSEVALVTDDEIIQSDAKGLGIRILEEPADLADAPTPMASVLLWTLPRMNSCDAVVLLQPTSPLRNADDVVACLRILKNSGCDSVVSVTASCLRIPERKFPMYERNGAVYASRPDVIRRGEVVGGWTQFYVMPPDRSADVDTAEDLQLARTYAGK